MEDSGDEVEAAVAATDILDYTLDDFTIDDSEFDIPEVDSAPSLESILNEPEESFEPDNHSLSFFSVGPDNSDSVSLSETPATPDKSPTANQKKNIQYEAHGSILRHVLLRGIASQVSSAADRVDAGKPTAIAISVQIAVGTSHGLILVFDPKQVLRWCLGSTAVGAQYGAVSALSINNDCTRLLAGFAKGQMTMWDLTSGKLLRTITDAHPPGSAVLHIQFTDDPTLAICSDSGGSVFELSMKRVMGMRTCESRCLFSGSRGEVCTLAPLRMDTTITSHPLKDFSLLAMATLSKVFIVGLRPRLTVMFTKQLRGDPSTLPLLAWQFVIIQVTDTAKVVDPVLACARTNTINFYQVLYQEDGNKVKFAPLQSIILSYSLLNVQWMNAKTLVTVDTTEKLHVIDVKTEEELEVIDLGDVELVYGSSHFKSLATGGNVSKALALAGERACYQSIATNKGQLIILGTKSIHVMSIRTWQQRLEVLLKAGKYKDCLRLASSYYNGKAKAVIGLVKKQPQRQAAVADKILEILFDFVEISMKQGPERGAIHLLEEHFQRVVPVCVEHCLMLGRKDVLFGSIYEQFRHDIIAKGVYLQCLEPYILNDRLTSVTPEVMKDFIEHYRQKELISNVEACIVHMDIASLDIHQVVSLCWAYGLYDAIIYVYNKGMNDYVTPLEELLQLLRAAVRATSQLSDNQIRLGNKLLVYISCCLAGRAYPMGDIPPHLVKDVKQGVWRCLTALHTTDPSPDEPTYPNLRTLLTFDTREFLNVMSLAFEEPEFDAPQEANSMQSRQRIVDILLQVMVESVGFSPAQVGCLFTFLARQMAKHENTIYVNRMLFEQVLEFLSNPSGETRHEEREQALLELLNAGDLLQVDHERLLQLAEGAKFYRVCEVLYERRREFDKILLCYLRDSSRKSSVFSYIHQVMIESYYTEPEKDAVQKQAIKHLQDLVAIDSKETAQLVLKVFAHSLSDVVIQLQNQPQLQYEFLEGVFDGRDTGSALYGREEAQPDCVLHEKFLDLMCTFSPKKVLNFVMMSENYRLEEALHIVRKHKMSEPTAFLLEKSGDIQGAFGILMENLQTKVKGLSDAVKGQDGNQNDGMDITLCLSNVQVVLMVLVQLCQRNSPKLDEEGRETLWFPLLDLMMTTQRRLKPSFNETQFESFKEVTRHVLNSMMGHLSLPRILQKIMQDPTYSTGRFGEIRELIVGMLDTYTYESTLLKTANRLLDRDLYGSVKNLTMAANRGLMPRRECCMMCGKNYAHSTESDNILIFSCGHTYHTTCLQTAGCSALIDGQRHWTCLQCYSARRGAALTPNRRPRLFSSGEEPKRGGGPTSPRGGAAGGSKDTADEDVSLNPEQEASLENLKKWTEGPSRLAILSEVLMSQRAHPTSKGLVKPNSILHQESFRLQLAPPPSDE
ncbi:vacuolar protein sorting-associated protein 8 homolog [Strongylocentrotus purpuratus]|uniref:RING-type domain-containing protein n=1 Tax=Strongylocentrotus purpuratus TaxID=7668 RepID=A0A7M7N478_STRPU|nr:vacuolar protein sorting-associated protein 8 homolog [Strongylocentrotus purpuratus]